MRTIVVREYARLTTDHVPATLDQATIPAKTFDWLSNLAAGFTKGGASLLQVENRRWLKLDSYVGVIQTPDGTLLEILPKHTEQADEGAVSAARALLIKMLSTALDLPIRTADKADIETFRHPLLEWVMKQFVLSLDHLVKRGLRFDYLRVEDEQRFLRGQLDMVKQMRQPPGRAHILNIRHDIYLPDRPENRLLKTALMLVCKTTRQQDTYRLAHELAGLMAEIPTSRDVHNDFKQWVNDRLMTHYQSIRPWCELVLGQFMPLALRGSTQGISLLFPMEKIFERYVEVVLTKQLVHPYRLKSQAASHSLCSHMGKSMFQLRPDLLIQRGSQTIAVLDTKWKLISGANRESKYGLSQADFYQLFAYGQRYLAGQGEMLLIYPRSAKFVDILPPFDFSADLRLWVAPFDLDTDEMHWPYGWSDTVFEQAQMAVAQR